MKKLPSVLFFCLVATVNYFAGSYNAYDKMKSLQSAWTNSNDHAYDSLEAKGPKNPLRVAISVPNGVEIISWTDLLFHQTRSLETMVRGGRIQGEWRWTRMLDNETFNEQRSKNFHAVTHDLDSLKLLVKKQEVRMVKMADQMIFLQKGQVQTSKKLEATMLELNEKTLQLGSISSSVKNLAFYIAEHDKLREDKGLVSETKLLVENTK